MLIFQYGDFFGPHRHVLAGEPNLGADDDSSFNDMVGSLVVLAGNWSFYSDWDFLALYNVFPAGPGTYPDLAMIDVLPDDMSSLRPAVPAQVTEGQDITGQVILFGNAASAGRTSTSSTPRTISTATTTTASTTASLRSW